jgi:hypothetical protein
MVLNYAWGFCLVSVLCCKALQGLYLSMLYIQDVPLKNIGLMLWVHSVFNKRSERDFATVFEQWGCLSF